MPFHARSSTVLLYAALMWWPIGCADATQPTVSGPAGPPPEIHIEPTARFPAAPPSAVVYEELPWLYAPAFRRDIASRYLLFEDGRFAMQFVGEWGFSEYSGRYTRAGSSLTFVWDANPTVPWTATGVVRGDELIVAYNLDMSLSDFIDGTYLLVRETN